MKETRIIGGIFIILSIVILLAAIAQSRGDQACMGGLCLFLGWFSIRESQREVVKSKNARDIDKL